MIVFDANFVGMSLLPSERDAILVVDPNAVPPCLMALQRLESITGRNREIFESRRDVERFELPLRDSPDLARDPPRKTRNAFAKQVSRRFVAERLNQRSIYMLHG